MNDTFKDERERGREREREPDIKYLGDFKF